MSSTPSSVSWCKRFPPHSYLHFLATENPDGFRKVVGADEVVVRQFSESLKASDVGARLWDVHPNLGSNTPQYLERTLPLALHEDADAGPYVKRRSANVLSLSSVLGVGLDIDCKWLVALPHTRSLMMGEKTRRCGLARRARVCSLLPDGWGLVGSQ